MYLFSKTTLSLCLSSFTPITDSKYKQKLFILLFLKHFSVLSRPTAKNVDTLLSPIAARLNLVPLYLKSIKNNTDFYTWKPVLTFFNTVCFSVLIYLGFLYSKNSPVSFAFYLVLDSVFINFFFLKKFSCFSSNFFKKNIFLRFLFNKSALHFSDFTNSVAKSFKSFNYCLYIFFSSIIAFFFNNYTNFKSVSITLHPLTTLNNFNVIFSFIKNSFYNSENAKLGVFCYHYMHYLFSNTFNDTALYALYSRNSDALSYSYLDPKFFTVGELPVDYSFFLRIRKYFVSTVQSFFTLNNQKRKHFLNYYFICNFMMSYRHFLFHFVGLVTKKGYRTKAFNVLFLLCLNFLKKNIKIDISFFMSVPLSLVQPMLRLFKLQNAAKVKVTPHRIVTTKLRLSGFNVLLRNAKVRLEHSLVLKLFSELLDISKLKGPSLKEKIGLLKLFIEHKPRLASSSLKHRGLRRRKYSFFI